MNQPTSPTTFGSAPAASPLSGELPTAFRMGSRRVWRYLLRNRPALIGLVVILVFTFLGIFGPALAPHDPTRIDLQNKNLPPAWTSTGLSTGNPTYPLGTDMNGRDLLSRTLYGARTAIFTAALAVPLAALLGTLIGIISGYAGRELDLALQRFVDIFQAVPQILIIILFALIFRKTPFGEWLNGVPALSIAFALSGWAGLARLVRSAVLTLRSQLFVESSRALGASTLRIIFRHILPNCLGLLVVWMTFTVPRAIVVEALLGYIGIYFGSTLEGKEFSLYSWGGLFFEGRRSILGHPTVLLIPALCITLVTSAFTFFGDGLRDALDPHQGT